MTKIKFTEEGQLTIAQFTDLHFMDGSAKDERTKTLVREVFEQCNPDLSILTGDFLYGEQNLELAQEVIDLFDSFGKPWSFCFGNHDSEEGAGRQEIFDYLRDNSQYCIAEDMNPAGPGVGDHRIDLVQGDDVRWSLYVMDSGDYMPEDPRYYDYVKPKQIAWLRKDQRELSVNSNKPGALMFLHIPLPEYRTLMQRGAYVGEANEDVCSPPLNSGLFAAMVESGTFRGVFCGHDHINNFHGELLGVALVYGQASGYNTYSHPGYRHGARLITVNADEPDFFQTRIYYDDGSISDPVQLGMPGGCWLDVE